MDKQIRKNIYALALLQKANYILPFIIIPYLTRVLGPNNFGKISFVQAVINYFLLVTDYGFNMSATQQVAINREDKEKVHKIFWTTTFSKLLLAFISLFALAFLLLLVPQMREDGLLYIIAFSIVLQSIFSPVWFLQGIEKTELIIPISILPKVFSLILIFLFVHDERDYVPALFIQCTSSFLFSVIVCSLIFYKNKLIGWYKPSFIEIKESLHNGWYLFISTAAISLYTTSNTVLLGIVTNNQIVGYFVAADKLIKGVQSLVFTIGQAAYPRINKYFQESKVKAAEFFWVCFRWMGGAGLIASIGLFLFASPIVKLVFGLKQYGLSVTIVQILSFTPLIVALGYVFGILGLLSFGFKRLYSRIYLIIGFLSLLLTIPLAYFYSMYGVAWSILLTEILITYVMYQKLHKTGFLTLHSINTKLVS